MVRKYLWIIGLNVWFWVTMSIFAFNPALEHPQVFGIHIPLTVFCCLVFFSPWLVARMRRVPLGTKGSTPWRHRLFTFGLLLDAIETDPRAESEVKQQPSLLPISLGIFFVGGVIFCLCLIVSGVTVVDSANSSGQMHL